MADIQISKRNFEIAKNRIKSFANNTPSSVQLPTLEEKGGIFNWFDKTVTGVEMNDITRKIQSVFIQQNTHIRKVYQEFGTLYNTFETLDKEYIQGIINSVKEAEEASKKAEEASRQAEENSRQAKENSLQAEKISLQAKTAFEGAQMAQADIKRVIEVLKLSVSKLEKTRDEFLYLKSDFEKIQKYFKTNSNGMIELHEAEKMEKKLEEQEKQITLLTAKITKIEKRRQHSIYWIAIGILLLALVRFVLPMIK